jgi:hypothetical protein
MLVRRFGLEVNIQKTEYMLLSCYQHTGQNQDLQIGTSFKNVSVQIFGTIVTNRNLIQEEIKRGEESVV